MNWKVFYYRNSVEKMFPKKHWKGLYIIYEWEKILQKKSNETFFVCLFLLLEFSEKGFTIGMH